MKKLLFIAVLVLIVLAGCSEADATKNLIHEDFKKDVDQMVNMLDKVYEEERTTNEREDGLYFKFHDKYITGSFQDDGKTYKMNDLEKAIVRKVQDLWVYNLMEQEETLASEKNEYEISKKKLNKYLSAEKVPEEIKGEYPTYELLQDKIFPDQFRSDVNNLLELYDPVINGTESNIGNDRYNPLTSFLDKYKGEGYELDGKYYYITSNMYDVIFMFDDLKIEIDSGHIMESTINDFNTTKETMEMLEGA